MGRLTLEQREEIVSILGKARSKLAALDKEAEDLEARLRELDEQRKEARGQRMMAELLLQEQEEKLSDASVQRASTRYSNMTIREACVDILEKAGRRSLSVREIVQRLIEGGKGFTTDASAATIVGTTMRRHPQIFSWRRHDGVNRFALRQPQAPNVDVKES